MKPLALTIALGCIMLALLAGCHTQPRQVHLRQFAAPPAARPAPVVADRHRSLALPAPAQQALRREVRPEQPETLPWYADWRDRRPIAAGTYAGPVYEHSTTWITERYGHIHGRPVHTHHQTTRRVRSSSSVR